MIRVICRKCAKVTEIEGDDKKVIRTCAKCKRKKRLQAKANKRGKPKNYYLEVSK